MGKRKRKKKGQSEQTKKPVEGIPLTPDIVEGLKEQFRRFEEKFGCPPGQDAPIFLDPAADEPRRMVYEVIDQHMVAYSRIERAVEVDVAGDRRRESCSPEHTSTLGV